MPCFDIVKKADVKKSFRVAKVMGDFDVKADHAQEHFTGEMDLPEEWQIGVIVGPSGTGKTTIAKEMFPDAYVLDYAYSAASVLDDMPADKSVDEITQMFYAVGFGSVPSWLKPYSVLSNGEKMRVNLARAFLEREFFVFDEFTSVVDRNVANTACITLSKAVRRTSKQFIAVTCHYDVLEWLQPDWVFDTEVMQLDFTIAHGRQNDLTLEHASGTSGLNLGSITI